MTATAPQTEPLTLTPAQAAAMIPMGINQFYAAVKAGTIPSLRIGRSIRIPRRRFLEWLDGGAGSDAH
jgi:excisionase family DNA binding protein